MTDPLSVLAAAIAPGSSREQRAAAADVCRMLIAALEAQEGQPLPISAAEAQPGEPVPIVASSARAAASAPVASADPAAPSAPVAPDAHQVAADAPHAEPLEPESRNRRTATHARRRSPPSARAPHRSAGRCFAHRGRPYAPNGNHAGPGDLSRALHGPGQGPARAFLQRARALPARAAAAWDQTPELNRHRIRSPRAALTSLRGSSLPRKKRPDARSLSLAFARSHDGR
jgi:hypothetical protein